MAVASAIASLRSPERSVTTSCREALESSRELRRAPASSGELWRASAEPPESFWRALESLPPESLRKPG
eukprot:15485454-Alexandrium_andersonii.AAC.1